jgi:hypothetical protein
MGDHLAVDLDRGALRAKRASHLLSIWVGIASKRGGAPLGATRVVTRGSAE